MPRGKIRNAEEVRGEILEAARALMIEGGVRAVRLREILARSGASNGQLYGIFANTDEIILGVNTETLGRLEHRLKSVDASDSLECLVALARCYLGFASDETPLWRALFEFVPADGGATAESLQADQARLFELAAGPLSELFPDLGEAEVLLRARTLFSAVHGIVSISLESRYAGVTIERLEDELAGLVRAALVGFRTVSPH
ncbi:TetR/AcrR family transcriptional regulator [Aurantimonas sp. VKM B-3413]|uniref:TetR/AcrR family transcriptional regulator n=1 Tax=Aurantimonas sp. VKM B-3413 TaxID=2779401 RepID=UPI001E52D9BF|nr:TetR/AcrR family transcriptional regulator [Aurantimonas sp. VKM B-3413]MCB8835904.1 TetR/AcrR family transcriptional regulator [Aurantimonas sp. VKM B-3413]